MAILPYGFLCSYKNATNFSDGTWIELEGVISKANYKGEIPLIRVTTIKEVPKPYDDVVLPPNGGYVETINMM